VADATTVQFVEGDSTTVQFVDGDATTVAIGDATTVVVEMSGIPIPGEEGGEGGFTESQIRAFAQDVVDDDTTLTRDTELATAVGLRLLASSNLSDLPSPSTARTNLGLGTAATSASTAFDASGSASSAQAFAIQRANHTGTQAPSTIAGTAVITTDPRLAVRRRVLSASALGAAISGTPLWDIGSTSAAALAAGSLLCCRSEIDSQQTVELLVNVTATALSSGQQIHLATYAMGANGLPTGAPVWSTPITVGTSTGVMATASVLLPPAPFFVSFLNPSTNAGTVTLTLAQPLAHVGLNFALTNRPVLVGPSSSTFPTVTGWTISSSAAASVWGTMSLAPVVVGRA
jgi:hypothetical protein